MNKELSKEEQTKLETCVPSSYKMAPMVYINTVNKMVLGTDKQGKNRPFEDLFYFLQVSKNAGLDPTLKQIYAVYRWNSAQGKEVMSIQTGIDGMRTIAERTGQYGGSDDAVFVKGKDYPAKASVTVYKLNPKTGERMPTTASARWLEYYPGDKQGMMWKKMPHVMLAKVAEALALRKAFPVASQVYVAEEMEQAQEVLPEPKKEKPIVKTNVKEIVKKVKEEK